jgi:hypothetical protein
VGAFTVVSGACGLVAGGRRRGWRGLLVPVRVVALVLSLSCFTAAGIVMLPTVVLGCLALARTDWPRRLRFVLGGLAVLSTAILLASGPGELGWGRLLGAYALYLGLVAVQVRIFCEPYRPSVGHLPLAAKVVAGLGAVAALLVVAGLVAGLFLQG